MSALLQSRRRNSAAFLYYPLKGIVLKIKENLINSTVRGEPFGSAQGERN